MAFDDRADSNVGPGLIVESRNWLEDVSLKRLWTFGNSIWIASEFIDDTCTYTDWGGPFFAGGSGDNLLGTCGGASHGPGTRTALADWNTRISKLTP